MATPQSIIDATPCLFSFDGPTLQRLMVGYLRSLAAQSGSDMTPQQVLDANPCLADMDSRTLQVLTVGYLSAVQSGGAATVTGYNGVADLRTRTEHGANSIAFIKYAATAGDGGQGWFVYDPTNSDADDGINTIIPNDVTRPAPGAWIRYT